MTVATRIEYRVVWQREGLEKRRKIYQTRDGAERYVRVLKGLLPWDTDPDAYYCCSGWECGCGGLTNREVENRDASKFPKLIYGPVIEEREVGDWQGAALNETKTSA